MHFSFEPNPSQKAIFITFYLFVSLLDRVIV